MRNTSKKAWTKHETEMEDEDARDFLQPSNCIFEYLQCKIGTSPVGKRSKDDIEKYVVYVFHDGNIHTPLCPDEERPWESWEWMIPEITKKQTSNLTDKILYAALLDSGKAFQWVQIDAFILYPHPVERVLHVFSPQLWSSCTMFGWKKCNRTKRRKGQLFHQA